MSDEISFKALEDSLKFTISQEAQRIQRELRFEYDAKFDSLKRDVASLSVDVNGDGRDKKSLDSRISYVTEIVLGMRGGQKWQLWISIISLIFILVELIAAVYIIAKVF